MATVSVHSISCVLLGRSGDDLQRDYWFTTARDWRRLEGPADVGRRAASRRCAGSGLVGCNALGAGAVRARLARGLIGHGRGQWHRPVPAQQLLLDAPEALLPPVAGERPHLGGWVAVDSEGVAAIVTSSWTGLQGV